MWHATEAKPGIAGAAVCQLGEHRQQKQPTHQLDGHADDILYRPARGVLSLCVIIFVTFVCLNLCCCCFLGAAAVVMATAAVVQ